MLGGESAMALPAEAVALHLNRFWRTLGAALGGMPKLKQIKAVS